MVLRRPLLHYKLHCRHYDLGDDSPSSVQFSIHPASKHHKIWIRSSNGDVLDEAEDPITESVAEVDHPPLTYDTSYSIVRDMLMLSFLDIGSRQQDWLIEEIIYAAAEIINMASHEGHTLWVVFVEIKIISEIYVEESELIQDETMMDSHGMVPASGSSIAALEQVVMFHKKTGDCNDNCAICLEEFSRDSHVSRMPCSHVFHGDCIIKWLNKSHYCPTCRFKMPT